jgi:hypothetical protein
LGHFEQGAKTTNSGQYTIPQGFLGQGLDAFNQGVTSVNVNASVFVGKRSVHERKGAKALKGEVDEWRILNAGSQAS